MRKYASTPFSLHALYVATRLCQICVSVLLYHVCVSFALLVLLYKLYISVYLLGKHVIKLHCCRLCTIIYMFADISWQT